ncbi:MAG: hypothetical protein OXT03_02625 [Alphaproteobacteria bacterium]|nr:hypothetical protein [Alphaproteobacteria bacterium]
MFESLFWLVLVAMAVATTAICSKPYWSLWSKWGLVGLAAILPVVAILLYLWLGAPTEPDYPLAPRLAKPLETLPPAAIVARLEAQLRVRPDDIKGWQLLAQARMAQNKPAQAADAWRQVIALGGENSENVTALAIALIGMEEGFVNAAAKSLLTRALNLNPNQAAALYFMGLAHQQEGDIEAAKTLWQKYRSVIEAQE